MSEKPREFRPGSIPTRSRLRLAFLTLVALVSLTAMTIDPRRSSLAPAAVLLLLVLPGLWIELRLRFPGRPRLMVDAHGLALRRGRTRRQMAWREVEAITVNDQRREMRIEPIDGSKPIIVHRTMIAEDGVHFDMLVERYWTLSQGRARNSWRRRRAKPENV